jgi:serine/threonine protein kinase
MTDKYLVGTKRYMSPELLSDTFGHQDFTNFIYSDIYSLGLVLWEIISRTRIHEGFTPDRYKVPFEDFYPQSSDPSIPEMKQIVCVEVRRPIICDYFGKNKILDMVFYRGEMRF